MPHEPQKDNRLGKTFTLQKEINCLFPIFTFYHGNVHAFPVRLRKQWLKLTSQFPVGLFSG